MFMQTKKQGSHAKQECELQHGYPYKMAKSLGPVVQSVVSLTSSLRVISLTVLAVNDIQYYDIFC